jgi:hypothetical protein
MTMTRTCHALIAMTPAVPAACVFALVSAYMRAGWTALRLINYQVINKGFVAAAASLVCMIVRFAVADELDDGLGDEDDEDQEDDNDEDDEQDDEDDDDQQQQQQPGDGLADDGLERGLAAAGDDEDDDDDDDDDGGVDDDDDNQDDDDDVDDDMPG